MVRNLLFGLMLLCPAILSAQSGVITGRIFDPINNEGIPFATVGIPGTSYGTTCDIDGLYRLEGLEPGLYNIEIRCIGFKPENRYEIRVTNNREAQIDIELEEDVLELEGVEIKANPFNKTAESPVSLQTIGVDEIARNPGGNRDISRVIQSLPGVSTTSSFRNDILIRGGAPNENRFFLDGVEVPVINHFATQGSSGGPVGMINVDLLREVDFYSSAFPSSRGNALSSVFDFKMKDARTDRWGGRFTVGSSDLALSVEGPISDKTAAVFSARRSYLQFLFRLFELPFLPTYNDFQFKVKTKFDNKNELSFIGLGAIDQFALNTDENETPEQQYLLDNLPVNEQWNYTVGAVYKRFHKNGFTTVVASRSMLDNSAVKYQDNDESSEDNLILNYKSQEAENKFRLENTTRVKGYKFTSGVRYEYGRYENSTFNRAVVDGQPILINYNSELGLHKYGAFFQVSRKLAQDKLTLSAGLAFDGADYGPAMNNPLDQASPRASMSWNFFGPLSFNANVGRYYQHPAYTVLGFRDELGNLVNRDNGIRYIRADHAVAGFEYNSNINTKITVEGFYKNYDNYPFLIRDSIALANLGADFGVIGDEPAIPTGEGRSYGFEVLAQQKLWKGFYGILAYTWVKSEFQDKNGEYVPSAWDNRSIISLTAGKKFKKNWEVGTAIRYSGGLPYTSADIETSALIENWDVANQAVLDFNQLNAARLASSYTVDLRVDKKWFFDKWNLNIFLDIVNLTYLAPPEPPVLTVVRDESGEPLVDPDDPTRYQTTFLETGSGIVQPSIGIIVDW